MFCARCNHATNPVYWKFSASCIGRFTEHDIPKNRTLMLEFIKNNCKWSFTVPIVNENLKNCLAVKVSCKTSEPHNLLLSYLCSFMLFIFVTVLSTRILIVKYVREKTSVRFHVIVTRLQTHPRTMTPRVDFCLWISYSISPLLIKLLKLDKQRQR